MNEPQKTVTGHRRSSDTGPDYPLGQNTAPPGLDAKTAPKLAVRHQRSLMLESASGSDDSPASVTQGDDALPAVKHKAVKQRHGMQTPPGGRPAIPSHAHFSNGGDFATVGEMVRRTDKPGRCECGPCILL